MKSIDTINAAFFSAFKIPHTATTLSPPLRFIVTTFPQCLFLADLSPLSLYHLVSIHIPVLTGKGNVPRQYAEILFMEQFRAMKKATP